MSAAVAYKKYLGIHRHCCKNRKAEQRCLHRGRINRAMLVGGAGYADNRNKCSFSNTALIHVSFVKYCRSPKQAALRKSKNAENS